MLSKTNPFSRPAWADRHNLNVHHSQYHHRASNHSRRDLSYGLDFPFTVRTAVPRSNRSNYFEPRRVGRSVSRSPQAPNATVDESAPAELEADLNLQLDTFAAQIPVTTASESAQFGNCISANFSLQGNCAKIYSTYLHPVVFRRMRKTHGVAWTS